MTTLFMCFIRRYKLLTGCASDAWKSKYWWRRMGKHRCQIRQADLQLQCVCGGTGRDAETARMSCFRPRCCIPGAGGVTPFMRRARTRRWISQRGIENAPGVSWGHASFTFWWLGRQAATSLDVLHFSFHHLHDIGGQRHKPRSAAIFSPLFKDQVKKSTTPFCLAASAPFSYASM